MGRFARTKRIARIVCMNELNNHYRMLLGLDEAWLVKSVDLSMESKRVVIALEHRGGSSDLPRMRYLLHASRFGSREDVAPPRYDAV